MDAPSLYAAFLRGMNVGGHRLTNAELRTHFEAIGLREVATFRASGNVVFAVEEHRPKDVQGRIEAGLEQRLGYAVPTFIRDAEELRTIAAARPFAEDQLSSANGKLQVSLLLEAPPASVRREVLAMADESDRLAFGARELFWLPSGGVLETGLDLRAIDRLLGIATTRTMGTLEQLARKHFAG
jgi:uncharacterized protein (DUF1697 family)